ncbi:MAG: CobD/CbiB family cobalamin biosynthesis protein, partial [Acidimicrobiia bacterium]
MSLAARLSRHMAGTVVGIVADRVLGEPPAFLHPVAGFGRAMGLIEDRAYEPTREAGIRHAVTGAALGLIGGRLLRSTAVASYVSVAGRGLGAAAHDVRGALAAGDLEAARARLPALVGRDPSVLDEGGISRAVVESVAENAVDAVVAPALWAALGGAAGATTYRAANTLDAMVGHHSDRYEEFGWASARL